MRKYRSAHTAQQTKASFEKSSPEIVTIQDESISIEEIMERSIRGMVDTTLVKTPVYTDENDQDFSEDFDKIKRSDPIDQKNAQDELYQKEIQEKTAAVEKRAAGLPDQKELEEGKPKADKKGALKGDTAEDAGGQQEAEKSDKNK